MCRGIGWRTIHTPKSRSAASSIFLSISLCGERGEYGFHNAHPDSTKGRSMLWRWDMLSLSFRCSWDPYDGGNWWGFKIIIFTIFRLKIFKAILKCNICLRMLVVVFISGKRLYKMKNPERNIVVEVVRCISVGGKITGYVWAYQSHQLINWQIILYSVQFRRGRSINMSRRRKSTG